MVIKLYKTDSDPRYVNKTLSNEVVINGVARQPLDILNPVIEVEDTNFQYAAYNYMYIEDYNRYYFIENTPESYNLETITGRHDPLMNSRVWLKQRNATIKRNENLYSAYLNDPEFNTYAYKNIVTKNFPYALNQDSIILMTVG